MLTSSAWRALVTTSYGAAQRGGVLQVLGVPSQHLGHAGVAGGLEVVSGAPRRAHRAESTRGGSPRTGGPRRSWRRLGGLPCPLGAAVACGAAQLLGDGLPAGLDGGAGDSAGGHVGNGRSMSVGARSTSTGNVTRICRVNALQTDWSAALWRLGQRVLGSVTYCLLPNRFR